jgi:hypothetical protein
MRLLRNSQLAFTRINIGHIMNSVMRRTSLTPDQAEALALVLRTRRNELGYSVRELEARSDVNIATIARLEHGDILTPQPDTLKGLAAALDP